MDERRSVSVELGIQFAYLMHVTYGEDRTAAEVIGVNMEKVGDRASVTITKEAAETYFDPDTGNSLGWILDEIVKNECAGDLKMTISKMESGDYIVIQKFSD